MKLNKLVCPDCGANIEMNLENRKAIFCPYCGSQFVIDSGDRSYTKNININKTITTRHIDDAKIAEEFKEYHESRGLYILIGLMFVLCIGMILVPFLNSYYIEYKTEKAKRAHSEKGYVTVGKSASELIGKNYQGVLQQLDAAGFINITTIELNDGGVFLNKPGTIDSISIGGDASFQAYDFFDPSQKVVISYH